MNSRTAQPVELHRLLASCPLCRNRWDRTLDLWELTRGRPDEENGVEAATVYAAILSPYGTVWFASGSDGLCRVELNTDELAFRRDLERVYGPTRYAPSRLSHVIDRFSRYFAGQSASLDLGVDLSAVTPFRRRVLQAVAEIPWGEVRGYGEIAQAVGKPGAGRAVGSTMAANPVSIIVPCHRVIRSDGSPGEYGYRALGPCGAAMKRAMLAAEGIKFARIAPHGYEAERRRVAMAR